MNKRKITRESLAELAKRMPVLSEYQQMAYVGGYDDHDCWWRCIAYMQTGGQDYSPDMAMSIASGYYGSNFNEESYAFSGNRDDYKNFISGYFSNLESGSYNSGQILIFDPNTTSGWEGDGSSYHAVIVTGYDDYGNMTVFDPKTRTETTIAQSAVSSGFVLNVK